MRRVDTRSSEEVKVSFPYTDTTIGVKASTVVHTYYIVMSGSSSCPLLLNILWSET